MKDFQQDLARRVDALLQARESELCAILAARDAIALPEDSRGTDVSDFKDAASRESLETVDAAQAEQAAIELEQVLAARGRLQDKTYGVCLDCGEPIAPERLQALPAAALCAACQAGRERLQARSGHSH